MQVILRFLVFISGIATAAAQSSVSGVVFYAGNEPASFINAALLQPSDSSLVKSQLTDEHGRFVFKNTAGGDYLLLVRTLGYLPVYQRFTVPSNHSDVILEPIRLLENQNALEEVSIVAKIPVFEHQADRTVLNVQQSVTAAGSNVLELLSKAPNVEVDRLNNQISLNGRSGAAVMINGKLVRMEQDALIQYLGSMPASNIKKIEFIHTPPASFDAAGAAGVINIQLVNRPDDGLNGSWSLDAGYGQRPKFGGAFNLNFRRGKWSGFADLSSSFNYSREDVNNTTVAYNNELTTSNELYSYRPAFKGLQNARIGGDYQLTRSTTVGVMVAAYYNQWGLDARTSATSETNNGYFSATKLRSVETNNWQHGMVNLNARHTFSDESALSFDLDVLNYLDLNPTDYQDSTFNRDGELVAYSEFNSRKRTPVQFRVGKVDYSRSLGKKVKMETGVKATISRFTNDVSVSRLTDGDWRTDSLFSSMLTLDEKIYAGYLSADYQISERTFFKAGLRFEQTSSHLYDRHGGSDILRLDFGRFFPTLSFSHRFNDKNNVQVSYNERIMRPAFGMIAPAFFFFGPNNIIGGNPAVRPAISRQSTLSYQMSSLSITLSLSKEEKPLMYQPAVDSETGVAVLRAENMESMEMAMLNLNYSKTIRWWTGQFSASGLYQRLSPYYQGKVYTSSGPFGWISTNQQIKLPAGFNVEFSAYYFSGRNIGLGTAPDAGLLNFGLQKQFGDHDRLTLNCFDMLNTGSFWGINYDRPDLGMGYFHRYDFEGAVVRLSYSHQFGNAGLKKSAGRSTASEEERQRVN